MDDFATRRLCEYSVPIKEFFNSKLSAVGVTYAFHLRIFNNGKAYILGNNLEYLQHCMANKYSIPEPGTYVDTELDLWIANIALQTYDAQVSNMRNVFNIDHQISFFIIINNILIFMI